VASVPGPLLAQILHAEDEREGVSPLLLALVDDPRPEVRERAAVALGRIGAARSAPFLLRKLGSETEPAVRGALCFALGLIGRPEATKKLVERLAYDPDVTVRCRAAHALGSIPGGLPVAALIAALPPVGVPVTGSRIDLVWQTVIGLVKQSDERAVEPLSLLATGADGPGRRAAVWALARLKKPAATSPLHRAFESDDPFVKAWAIRGLSNLKATSLHEALAGLAHPDPLVRTYAIGAAGASKLTPCESALLGVARDDLDPNLRIEAIHALGHIRSTNAIRLLLSLRVGPGTLARAADLALARIGVPETMLFTGLSPSTRGWTVLDWLGWVETLAALGGAHAKQRLSRLAVGLDGPDQGRNVIAAAAAGAIAQGSQPPEAASLAFHLRDRDLFHRSAVVESFVKHKGVHAIPTLTDLYRSSLTDPIDDFRTALVQAACDLKAHRTAALLRYASQDPSRNVRKLALEGLAGLAGVKRPVDPGTVGAGRPMSFYRAVADRTQVRPRATVITTLGEFKIELFSDVAPLTVSNFTHLAGKGTFDGLAISRVVPGFVVQLGDPRGDMSGSPGHTIRCEVSPLPYEPGTVGMALSGKDTGGSQFFVTHTRQPHLDGVYTVFGRVVSGLETIDRLVKGDRILSIRVM
jgi:cyclophilin family peptidyl-prolyl cis-trans isomerase/HEAT repeat protein